MPETGTKRGAPGRELGANMYQQLAERTMNQQLSTEQTVQHALFGMSSELGEIMSLYQHRLQEGKAVDLKELKKELGDLCWFINELLTAYEIPFANVLMTNINKLKNRYPDGFDRERSAIRHELEKIEKELEDDE